jgi:hypothetical protein
MDIFNEFGRLNDEGPVTEEHLFAAFQKLDDRIFQKEFTRVIAHNNDINETFEPFFEPNEENDIVF